MLSCLSKLQRWKRLLLACIVVYVGIIIIYEYHYEEVRELLSSTASKKTPTQTLIPKLRKQNGSSTRIAIGLGITSRRIKQAKEDNLHQKFIFFKVFLPSFCNTISRGYAYHFYLGYDSTDKILAKDRLRRAFITTFINMTSTPACNRDNSTSIHFNFVRCEHKRKPPWAQNDAMIEAYLDGMEYFYRVNDDTIMVSANWTETLINALHQYQPPNLGVVGPVQRGKTILTYDFVHRTHVEIFGFYYPRLFTDWWADSWITAVYKPRHMKALSSVRLHHTMQMGQRYGINRSKRYHVAGQIDMDRITLNKYIQRSTLPKVHQNISKVISMSLTSGDAKITWEAVRNAQIARVFFSDWSLRVYMQSQDCSRNKPAIPERILASLQDLDVEIIRVNKCDIDIQYLPLLALDDASIDVFLIGQFRLNESDCDAISSWLSSGQVCVNLSELKSTDTSGFMVKSTPTRPSNESSVESLLTNMDTTLNQSGNHSDMTDLLSKIVQHPCGHADTVHVVT
ncbi:hypothetical protein CAPTEDRAFT_186286 [Capitella teleta]|uniref:Uncharacterized protein n=1 Tax=Capitella teleta TaxID=283909 RepID=R7V8V3_CAPTE|nr:hypothetical protein CAPTEDRAFT_186286 [Capitella teleta]|eukprot:ELU14999.1 hypothetical protein CAPTEDRAFT_186286 [Capitella teleta]